MLDEGAMPPGLAPNSVVIWEAMKRAECRCMRNAEIGASLAQEIARLQTRLAENQLDIQREQQRAETLAALRASVRPAQPEEEPTD